MRGVQVAVGRWLCAVGVAMSGCGGGGGEASPALEPPAAAPAPAAQAPVTAPAPALAAPSAPSVEVHAGYADAAIGMHCTAAQHDDWLASSGPSYARRVTPRDCRVMHDNPPVFAWPPHPEAAAGARYRLEVHAADGTLAARLDSDVPYAHLASPLPEGDYRWSVNVERAGGTSVTSAPRRFRIGAQALAMRLPSVDEALANARAKPRPRLLPGPAAWSSALQAATRVDGSRRTLVVAWLAAARRSVGAALPAEPALRTRDSTVDGATWIAHLNDVAARTNELTHSVIKLAVLAHVADDGALRAEAVRRLVHLAGWSPEGMTSETHQDQANRAIYFALAAGYDLLHDRLDAAQRVLIERRVRERVQQQHDGAFAALRSGALPYNSHGVTGATLAAAATMLMVGSAAQLDAMALAYYRWLVPNLLVWGDQDGADGNGHAYGWFNLGYALPALVVMDHAAGARLQQRAVVRNSPLWQAHFTPPPSAAAAASKALSVMTFGDGSDENYAYVHEFHATTSRFFAALLPESAGRRAAAWLWQSHPTRTLAAQQDPLFLLTADTPVAAVAPPDDAAVFPDAGLVAMHSSLADPMRSSLYFRASSFGTYNHSIADNGAFVFSLGGQPLLVNSGYYDHYWSDHHARYARHTKAKNALTVDGGLGQALDEITGRTTVAPSMAAAARLLGFGRDGEFTVASAELGPAYHTVRNDRPATALLSSYTRTVAYDKERRVAFVLDEAASATARSFELNFHAVGAWTPQASGGFSTANAAGSACLDVVLRNGALRSSVTDRFLDLEGREVTPAREHRRHHHLTLATTAAAPSFGALTVIRERCDTPLPAVEWREGGVRVSWPGGGVRSFGASGLR